MRNSQRSRRALVGIFLGVIALFPLLGAVTGQMSLVLIVLVPYLAATVLLGAGTSGLLDRPQRSLDERELEVRRTVFREPYLTGATIGLAGGIVVAAATRAEDAPMMGVMLFVVALLYGLPLLLLTWRMPDQADDDE